MEETIFKSEYNERIQNNIEIWVSLSSIGFEKYEISSYGMIRNVKSMRNLNISTNIEGYRIVVLNNNKKRITKSIHRLLAEIFIENEEGKSTVDHKDKNKINNDLKNLRWATQIEQLYNRNKYIKHNIREIVQKDNENNHIKTWTSMKEIIKNNNKYSKSTIYQVLSGRIKRAYNYKWEYNISSLDNEEWRRHPIHNLFLSNKGRFKEKENGIPKYGSDNGKGIIINIKQKRYYVHRLIIECFRGIKSYRQVLHINGNKSDNNIENLKYKKNAFNNPKSVLKINKNTDNIIMIYDNMKIGAEKNNIKCSGDISRACNGTNLSAGGFKWRYESDPEYRKKVKKFRRKNITNQEIVINKKRKIPDEIQISKKKFKNM